MLEDILWLEFNILGEFRAEHAAPLAGEVSPTLQPGTASGWHYSMPFVVLSGRCRMLVHILDQALLARYMLCRRYQIFGCAEYVARPSYPQ